MHYSEVKNSKEPARRWTKDALLPGNSSRPTNTSSTAAKPSSHSLRPSLMTIDEVASELRCSVRHIHNLMRRGHLRFLRHGGKMVRIHRASVEHYIAEWSMGGE